MTVNYYVYKNSLSSFLFPMQFWHVGFFIIPCGIQQVKMKLVIYFFLPLVHARVCPRRDEAVQGLG